jgi:hypothetical protein
MAERPPVPPELKRRVIRAMFPVLVGFLTLNGAGFYLLFNESNYAGIVCFLAATGLATGFHLWTRRLPPPYGRG